MPTANTDRSEIQFPSDDIRLGQPACVIQLDPSYFVVIVSAARAAVASAEEAAAQAVEAAASADQAAFEAVALAAGQSAEEAAQNAAAESAEESALHDLERGFENGGITAEKFNEALNDGSIPDGAQ